MRNLTTIAALALILGGTPADAGLRHDALNNQIVALADSSLAEIFARCRREVRQTFHVNYRGKGGKVRAIRQLQIDACVRNAGR